MDVWSPDTWSKEMKMALSVLFGVIVMCLLSFLSKPATIHADLRELLVHAAQMHEISKQDSDPAIALQHNTTALAYLSMARRFASDSALQLAAKVHPSDLDRALTAHQAACIAALQPGREATLTSLVAGYSTL